MSSYLNTLSNGESHLRIDHLELHLDVLQESSQIPNDAVQAIKSPSITFYSKGSSIYLSSIDGSLVHLDPIDRKSRGYLSKEILNDTERLFSLITATLVKMLEYHSIHFLHAAALESHGVGFLISGDGGCGKTTTSLSLLRAGFKYLSDDSLFFTDVHDRIEVYPLSNKLHIDKDLSRRFPELMNGKKQPIPEKTKLPVDVSEIYPGSFITHMTPNVIIFPKITLHDKTKIHPLEQIQAYNKLLTQTILSFDKNIAEKQLKILQKLVSKTLSYELFSGKDVYKNPSLLIDVISNLKKNNEYN